MDTKVASVLGGFRTLAAAGAFILLGVLSAVGSIDLTPLIALFVKNPAYLGACMVLIGLMFGYLRFVTHTDVFKNLAGVDNDGNALKHGFDAGT